MLAPWEYPPQNAHRFAQTGRRGERAINGTGRRVSASHKQDPREFLARNDDRKETFIVFLADVIRWLKLLDELGFADERFYPRASHLIVNTPNLIRQPLYADVVRLPTEALAKVGASEITGHTAFQIRRFAHVEHSPFGVLHQVHTGRWWELQRSHINGHG